jgi:hypothetical protein
VVENKYLYLYLDNEFMTGYVGETKNLKRRHMDHKGDIWPGRRELVSKIGEPVVIKADFKNMNAVKFAEHAVYEKYKAEGYDMLQKPPHPNIFKKYKDRIDDCQICDELGCDFTKERLEYILAVHRISKLCPICNKPFYFDPVKHDRIDRFYERTYCSLVCVGKSQREDSGEDFNVCEHCGKKFYYDWKKHHSYKRFNKKKYCSKKCEVKAIHKDSIKIFKVCEYCGEKFYFDREKYRGPGSFKKVKYCSTTCSNRAKGKLQCQGSYNVSKLCMCPTCNKPFYYDKNKHRSIPNFNKRTYCSLKCSKWEYNTGSHNISKLCPVCNKPFYYDKNIQSLSAFNKITCCSIDCTDKKQYKDSFNVSKLCLKCNKPFYYDKKKHQSLSVFYKRDYCSHTCANKVTVKLHLKGENAPNTDLTNNIVRDIKRKLLTMTYWGAINDIAAIYNVSADTISNIKRGKSFTDVKIDEDGDLNG